MNAPKESTAPVAAGTGASQWQKIYGSNPRGEFRRERLPDPLGYYASEGIQLSGRGAWRDAVCPFHADTRPSLRVHVESGAFRCMSCGASGGDILSFHRRRHVLGFVEAAQALGAWSAL